jgi:hypothetical protein
MKQFQTDLGVCLYVNVYNRGVLWFAKKNKYAYAVTDTVKIYYILGGTLK